MTIGQNHNLDLLGLLTALGAVPVLLVVAVSREGFVSCQISVRGKIQ